MDICNFAVDVTTSTHSSSELWILNLQYGVYPYGIERMFSPAADDKSRVTDANRANVRGVRVSKDPTKEILLIHASALYVCPY